MELKLGGWGKEFPHPACPCSAISASSSQALCYATVTFSVRSLMWIKSQHCTWFTLLLVWFVYICQCSRKNPPFSSTLSMRETLEECYSAAVAIQNPLAEDSWKKSHIWDKQAIWVIQIEEKAKGSYSFSVLQGAGQPFSSWSHAR